MLAGSKSNLKQTFPILRVPDIVECLNEVEIGYKLSEEEILKPTMQRVCLLFESVAEILMHQHVAPDNSQFKMMEILEHPELHRDSIQLLSLFKLMMKLLPNIGIYDFGLQDLIKPDPARYRKILSGLINFIKFREDRGQFFEKCTAESESAIELAKVLESKNIALNEKVNAIKKERAAHEPQVLSLKAANTDLTNQLMELQKIQKSAASTIEGLKMEKKEKETKLENIKLSITSTRQECERLKSRIVHNPEQLKHAIKDMKSNVESSKKYVAELDDKDRRLAQKVELMASVEADVESCLKIINECACDAKIYERASSVNGSLKENLEANQSALRDLAIKKQQAQRQLNSCHDRINRLIKHQGLKRETVEKSILELQIAYKEVCVEREEKAEAIKRCDMEEAVVQEKMCVMYDHMASFHASTLSALQAKLEVL